MNKLIYVAVFGVALAQLQGCTTAGGEPVNLDRRSAGAYIGDQEIEMRAKNRMRDTFPIKVANNISPTSYNRQLLLTGQVPDEATRAKAEELAKGIQEVRTVFNELTVSGATSVASGASDATVTTGVKTRLLRDKTVPGTKIKVVTENGVVYLMGLLKRAEADTATEIARNTAGVAKVVVLFEFID
jgi:osmotically-inducible protein OsmY